MPDTTISSVDKSLEVLLQAEKDFPGYPKIYFGKLNAQAWAMVGSSNLTKSGLSLNVEHNLFITGQRHTEPFISIEAQIAAFRNQAYLFDADIREDAGDATTLFILLGENPFP